MADAHRPLLVKHDAEEGHYLVYDITIEDEQRLEFHPLSRPVVGPLHYRPLAVSAGGTNIILGVTPQLPPPAAIAGGLRDMGPPIMLAVGDDTVIRMDTVVYGDPSRFEMLRRRLLASGGWSTTPLPRPPLRTLRLPFQSVSISAYFVMGTRVWITVTGQGAFSLDTQLGTWRMELPELITVTKVCKP